MTHTTRITRTIFAISVLLVPVMVQAQRYFSDTAQRNEKRAAVARVRRWPCRDTITCELPRRINSIDHFLRTRKVGLFTPDPRSLTPEGEVIRLNVVPQALGYLNLYESTRQPRYLREANDRLQHLLNIGPETYGAGVRTGMIGYAFLRGYQASGRQEYLNAATEIAEGCLVQPLPHRWMNGGLMCGFHLAVMWKQTGDVRYQTESRKIAERTSVWQYPNGSWPHQPHPDGGNTSYTAWMTTELLMMRQADPGSNLNDFLLSKALDFLSQRVNPDGSLNYSDAQGSYYADPGNADSRYSTGELANVAVDLAAGGRRDQANALLRKLFSYELPNPNRGGYPDKYDLINPSNLWETGNPSVVRTSLILWYLSMIQLYDTPCVNGGTKTCDISSPVCSELYRNASQCSQSRPGTQTCIAGSYTSCFDLETTRLSEPAVCQIDTYCEQDPQWGACYYECYRYGRQVCIDGTCGGMCYAVQEGEVQCDGGCSPGEQCPATMKARPSEAIP